MNILMQQGRAQPPQPPSLDAVMQAAPVVGLVVVLVLLALVQMPPANAEVFKLIAAGLLGAVTTSRRTPNGGPQ